ncbi:MAG: DUF2333 family protein [Gammaproteobacteria bacterium]|nr:DUF2333 family protein [Gammaproteobacteria bacterium]
MKQLFRQIVKRQSFDVVWRVVAGVVAAYLVAVLAIWWWWDAEPDQFDVKALTESAARESGDRAVTGYVTTATMIEIARTLLESRGGYLSNDIAPPGVWMDNVPNWEFGVLVQLRDFSRAMRHEFSRSQSQSAEDPDLAEAEGKFFYDNSSWLFPASESEYRDGIAHVERYLQRIADEQAPDAQFYARADNLRAWLSAVDSRLGSLSQSLSASVGKRQLDLALAGDRAANQATSAPAETYVKTPWTKIDDYFYQARGQTWALLHLLRAIEIDFADVLDDKNARVSLAQIIRELEGSQQALWSPMVLNGGGFGMLANHSLVMASYVSRTNAALNDLRMLLAEG